MLSPMKLFVLVYLLNAGLVKLQTWQENPSNDIQDVVRRLSGKMEEQQKTIDMVVKLVKQQGVLISSLATDVKNLATDNKNIASDVKNVIFKVENNQAATKNIEEHIQQEIDANEIVARRIEKNQIKESGELKNAGRNISKLSDGVFNNALEIKNKNQEMKHLVFDAKRVYIVSTFKDTVRLIQYKAARDGLTTTHGTSEASQWILRMDEGSGCFRIFNAKYKTYRIALWRALKLVTVVGGDYPDQLWRFQYQNNGYYYMFNCYYPDFNIQIQNDGMPVSKKGKFQGNELWKLAPALEH